MAGIPGAKIDGRITTEYSLANKGEGPIPTESEYRNAIKQHKITETDILTNSGIFKTLSDKDLKKIISLLTDGSNKPGLIESRIISELQFQAAQGNKSQYQITAKYPLNATDIRTVNLTAASNAGDIKIALEKNPLISDCAERTSSFLLDDTLDDHRKLLALALHKTGYLSKEAFNKVIDHPSWNKDVLKAAIDDLQKTHAITDGEDGGKIGFGSKDKVGTMQALYAELDRLVK